MLAPKNKCTGCGACINTCPKQAINFVPDKEGFLYPCINEVKCVLCGLCEETCPVLCNDTEFNTPIEMWGGYAEDEKIREKGTSGGVVGELIQITIQNKGAVFASAFVEGNLQHVRLDAEFIAKNKTFQGSKYIWSDSSISLRHVLLSLKDDRIPMVLFIGTPCQVDGLIHYLLRKQCKVDKLYTVSFICGGVSNAALLDRLLRCRSTNYDEIVFRRKKEYKICLKSAGKTVHEEDRRHSLFYWGYNAHLITRKACGECPYAKKERVGDITVGDLWGGDKIPMLKDTAGGLSLILTTTEKGVRLCSMASLRLWELNEYYHILCENNPRLQRPAGKRNRLFSIVQEVVGTRAALLMIEGPKYLKILFAEKAAGKTNGKD